MTLTRKDTAYLKGLAILMIMLHNFCHFLPKSVTENEYTFGADRFDLLCTYFSHGGPHVILNTFSHFGHYGVPLFLFLSGYGLVCKYELGRHRRYYRTLWQRLGRDLLFLWNHCVKMWKLMLPAIALYWAYRMYAGQPWQVRGNDLAAMVTFTANLFIKRDLILGPWWFFSLIIQLYIIYRFIFFHYRSTFTLVAVTLACFSLQGFLYVADVRLTPEGVVQMFDTNPYHTDLFNYCRYNAVAWLLPFSIGILAARSQWLRRWEPNGFVLVLCSMAGFALVVWAATDAIQWLLSPIYVLLAFIPIALLTKTGVLRKLLEWTGGISATLFALHPIARAMTVKAAKQAEYAGQWIEIYMHIALYLAISFAAAWALNCLLKFIDQVIAKSWTSK